MSNSIYQEIILHEYKNPRHYGKLTGDRVIIKTVNNPLCGDKITFYGKVKGRVLVDMTFEGVGCAISVASASLLSDVIIGKEIDTIQKIGQEEVLELLGIELSPNRLKCALLPLVGITKIIGVK